MRMQNKETFYSLILILLATVAFSSLYVTSAAAQPCALQKLYGISRIDINTNKDADTNVLYSIDHRTGAVTLIGLTGYKWISSLDFNYVTGQLFAVGGPTEGMCCSPGVTVLLLIDPCTGAATEIGSLGLSLPGNSNTVPDISFRDSDQALFAYSRQEADLKTINTSTGLATLVGPSGLGKPRGNGIAFSPNDTLFHAGGLGEAVSTLNPNTGAATFVADLNFDDIPVGPKDPRINAMDFFPGTERLYVSIHTGSDNGGPTYLGRLNTTTGVVTNIGETVPILDSLAFTGSPITEVPTLSEWGLIAMAGILGIIGFMVMRRRKVTA